MNNNYCYFCKIKFHVPEYEHLGEKIEVKIEQITHFAHRKCINDYNNDIIKNINVNDIINDENVNHPQHYGGEHDVYEAIKIIEHYKFGFCIGNAIKYILRAGKKDESKYIEDLEKAAWYLNHKINQLKKTKTNEKEN